MAVFPCTIALSLSEIVQNVYTILLLSYKVSIESTLIWVFWNQWVFLKPFMCILVRLNDILTLKSFVQRMYILHIGTYWSKM